MVIYGLQKGTKKINLLLRQAAALWGNESAVRCCIFHNIRAKAMPTSAMPAPTREGELYPKPAAMGKPPKKAPSAFPTLNAAWVAAAPISSPSAAVRIISSCIGVASAIDKAAAINVKQRERVW